MFRRTHYPVIKRLFLVQIASIVIGVLCIYLIMDRHAAGVLAAAVEEENARVASRIEENQEKWRAWFELGMVLALERELDAFKQEHPVKSIRVVGGENGHGIDDVGRVGSQQKGHKDSYVTYELDHDRIRSEMPERSGTVTVLTAVGVLLLMMVIYSAWYVRRYIYSPISRLICEFDRMNKTGVLCLDDIRGKGEIAQFIDEFRKMHKRIKEGEKLRAEGEISRHVAHDMRSPLAVLKSYVAMSVHQVEPECESFRQAAERSVGKLLRMAEDLIDYAKATKITRYETDISGLIYKGVVPEVRERCDGVHVVIRYVVREGFLLNVDAEKIERTLVNLLNNAVQALDEEGEVIVEASPYLGTKLLLTVCDNGRGIPEMDLPYVFDAFFTKGKKHGTGLGLAYCKQVVEAHGGKIEVESEVGKGTTFRIIIPNAVVDAPSDVQEKPDRILTKATALTVPISGKNYAVIDDDDDIREQWRRIIDEKGGRIVYSAATVAEVKGSESIDAETIDTAIVDYHYEGDPETGIDLIAYLKQRGIKRVHLCTGFHDDEDICRRARAAGADSVIPKPIDDSVVKALFS